MKKLMIAIPSLDYIHWRFAKCLTNLTRRLDSIDVSYDVRFKGGTLVYISRDELVKSAVAEGFKHILWLDADMIFPETVYEDLAKNDMEIVSSVCRGRHTDNKSVLFSSLYPPSRIEGFGEKLIPIEACGFGCALARTDTMRAVMDHYTTCFEPLQGLGEDLSFCDRLNRISKGKIFADPTVKVGHIGQGIIWPDKSVEWI